MNEWTSLLAHEQLEPALVEDAAESIAAGLGRVVAAEVYPLSITFAHRTCFFLGRRGTEKHLFLLSETPNRVLDGFQGTDDRVVLDRQTLTLRTCSLSYPNALALHAALPFTKPVTLGLTASVGCGDRLGLATPGHVRAVRKTDMAPIFAQQSIREMERTGRTPEDVINDATWGVFQEGWRGGYGADADHLKTRADIDACVAAGFTFYTFDPREHVDNDAHSDPPTILEDKVAALPWDRLEDDLAALQARYLKTFDIEESFTITFDRETLFRAAAKYGRAIAHVAGMYRYLAQAMAGRPFEVEVSVDETDTPTSPEEHLFIACELKRLGVQWVSLAPRYVGRFEKGVDYIGDLAELECHIMRHAAIARHCGPYKLSIHSGSDKFSVYPIMALYTRNLVHLKTAGTSYLEALHAVASVDPDLFRRILDLSFERYEQDRVSYHVSANPALALRSGGLSDVELPRVLENFHNRQMLHVTFGSVLNEPCLRTRLFAALRRNEEAYYRVLEKHFDRHLEAFG